MLSRHLWLQRPVALQTMSEGLEKKKKKMLMEGDFAVNWVLPLVNRENLIVSYEEDRSRTRLALLLVTTKCGVLKFPMVTPRRHIKVRLEN